MTTLTAAEIAARDRLQDPVEFTTKLLGATIYEKQGEMLRAISRAPRVTVAGANGTGKDFAAARAVLWWLNVYQPSKVIVIAPTWRQVNDIVWNEVRAAYNGKVVSNTWGLRMYQTPRLVSEASPEDHFAVGFSTADSAGEGAMPLGAGLAGYHSPHLLAIVSEAHAVRPHHIDTLRRLNPQCFLMTGNPFAMSGAFYESHHGQRELYEAITISAFDTPNLQDDAPDEGYENLPGMVTKRNVRARAEEWGEDSPLYTAGVLGEFPDNLDDTVVPLWAITEAERRETIPVGKEPVILACDVARFGRDKTVVVRRQGDVARIVWRVQGRDTMKIAGWLGNYITENRVAALVVDDTGVGGGVTDRLREVGTGQTALIPFTAGASASQDDRFVNATAEVWWATRKWLIADDSRADIEADPALTGQLSSRGFSYQSDKRVQLESKSKMSKSPDEADALTMTFDYRTVVMDMHQLGRERKESIWRGIR